ncbi:MAG: potassium channel family protein [Thermoplasmatota archaeon]
MKIARKLSENKWFIILIFAAVGSVLGWIGYYKMYHDDGWTVFDVTYVVLRLFLINVNEYGVPIPWELEAGRFILPVVSSYAVVLIVLKLFGEKIKYMKIRGWRNHIVICGLGDKGYLLARDLNKKNKVVVIEKDPNNVKTDLCSEEGITVIHGDATQKLILQRANVIRAKYLFAVTGSDVTNTEIALTQAKMVKSSKRVSKTSCFVHIKNKKFCDLLGTSRKRVMKAGISTVRYFNIYEYSARRIFDRYPMIDREPKEVEDPVHIVIFGFDSLGESLLTQALKIGHFTDGKTLRISIVDDNLKEKEAIFFDRYPEVKNIDNISLDFWDIHIDESGFFRTGSIKHIMVPGPDAVYLSFEDDMRNVAAALHLNNRGYLRDIPVIINVISKYRVASKFKKGMSEQSGDGIFHVFKTIKSVCNGRTIIDGEMDMIAKLIHNSYLKERKREGSFDPDKPSHRIWSRLPEVFKDANRQQADHIDVKLRFIGCHRRKGIDAHALKKFTTMEVERLSKMEHLRWNAEKFINGWVLGNDTENLESPYLVSWDELSEEIREYDREAVRNLPRILGSGGIGIYRDKDRI